MIRLRTLGELVLVACVIPGLIGCGSQKGDLGAEREELMPTVRTAATDIDSEEKDARNAPAEVADISKAEQVAETLVEPAAAEVVLSRSADTAAAVAKVREAANENIKDEPKPAEGEKPVEGETPKAGEQPQPAPQPTTPSAEETPEQKAARLLKEAERLSGVKTQASLQEAEAAYQTGLKLFNDLEYERAKVYFERAVALDPANAAALQKLRTVNALLGIHVDKIATKIRELEESERVKIQEQMVSVGQIMEEARDLEARGSQETVETEPAQKEKVLQEQLENLHKAQDRYRRAKQIIIYLPPNFDLPGGRAQVDAALARVRQKITAKEDEISFLRRMEAQRMAEGARMRETELFKARISKLLDQVKDLYDAHNYKAAERLSISILQLDPLNSNAESWKSKARAGYHADTRASILEEQHSETRRSWDDVNEAYIGENALLTYPPNWSEITKRSEANALGKPTAPAEPWKADIERILQRKVTFEFVDTPFDQAIAFLREMSNVTIVVDPKVMAAGPAPITLRVNDMNLKQALEWILKLADLSYVLKDNAIWISKEKELTEAVELRIYDVSDLTASVPDFPGPDLQLTTTGAGGTPGGGGPSGGGGGAPQANAFQVQAQAPTGPTVASISQMIHDRVRPESWDPALGTSIDEKAGKLVVMQRPEVHDLIDQLLSNFRATQNLMVNIESRFLELREAYLEEIGVEMQGLDPNVLTGDYGDVSRLGPYVQPRQPGEFNATPPNVYFPGMITQPVNFMGGTMGSVGTDINHYITFAAENQGTISNLDASNTVANGGLSAQVTLLNNTQMNAFIKALAARENQTTLTAPRLTVFNTQRANMFICAQQSYVGNYNIVGDMYEPEVQQFMTGVVLDVRPIVSSDRRYVTMELRPTVATLLSFTTINMQSVQIIQGTTTAVPIVLVLPIQFPDIQIQRVRTTATVPDGGVMVVSGLYNCTRFNAENGVPFLSDLPVIGRLFRWNTVDNVKDNLTILVSPKIILFSEEEEKM